MEIKYIRNKKNQIVIGISDNEIFYLNNQLEKQKQEEQSIFFIKNSSSLLIDYIKDCAFRLSTILLLQEELENIDNDYLGYIEEEIKNYSKEWKIIIDRINTMPYEIILFEKEASGHASAWSDKLYISCENGLFTLISTRKHYLSASEIIQYYGLEDEDWEFWNRTLDNGEMIVLCNQEVENAQNLIDNIIYILTNEEQWHIEEDEIDWKYIAEKLITNHETESIGNDLLNILIK